MKILLIRHRSAQSCLLEFCQKHRELIANCGLWQYDTSNIILMPFVHHKCVYCLISCCAISVISSMESDSQKLDQDRHALRDNTLYEKNTLIVH